MAGDRLAGGVYNREAHLDGQTVVTTAVVEVRMMGAGTWLGSYPVAFTESGNAYRLGLPSPTFGVACAKAFIRARLVEHLSGWHWPSAGEGVGAVVEAALDTSFNNFECIDVYETSFKPI